MIHDILKGDMNIGLHAILEGITGRYNHAGDNVPAHVERYKKRAWDDAINGMGLPPEVRAAENFTDADLADKKKKKLKTQWGSASNEAKSAAMKRLGAARDKADKLLRQVETLNRMYIPPHAYSDASDPNFIGGRAISNGETGDKVFNMEYHEGMRHLLVDILALAELRQPGMLDDNAIGYLLQNSLEIKSVVAGLPYTEYTAEIARGTASQIDEDNDLDPNIHPSILDIARESDYDAEQYTTALLDKAHKYKEAVLEGRIYANEDETLIGNISIPGIGECDMFTFDATDDADDNALITYYICRQYGLTLAQATVDGDGRLRELEGYGIGGERRPFNSRDRLWINVQRSLLEWLVGTGVVKDAVSRSNGLAGIAGSNLFNSVDSNVALNSPDSFGMDSLPVNASIIRNIIDDGIAPKQKIVSLVYKCMIGNEDDDDTQRADKTLAEIMNMTGLGGREQSLNMGVRFAARAGFVLLFILRAFRHNPYSKGELKRLFQSDGGHTMSHELDSAVSGGVGMLIDPETIEIMESSCNDAEELSKFRDDCLTEWDHSVIKLGDDFFYRALDYSSIDLQTVDKMKHIAQQLTRGGKKARYFINRFCNSRFMHLVTSIGDPSEREGTISNINDLYMYCYNTDSEGLAAFAPDTEGEGPRYKDPVRDKLSGLRERIGNDTVKDMLIMINMVDGFYRSARNGNELDSAAMNILSKRIIQAAEDQDLVLDVLALALRHEATNLSLDAAVNAFIYAGYQIEPREIASVVVDRMRGLADTADNEVHDIIEMLKIMAIPNAQRPGGYPTRTDLIVGVMNDDMFVPMIVKWMGTSIDIARDVMEFVDGLINKQSISPDSFKKLVKRIGYVNVNADHPFWTLYSMLVVLRQGNTGYGTYDFWFPGNTIQGVVDELKKALSRYKDVKEYPAYDDMIMLMGSYSFLTLVPKSTKLDALANIPYVLYTAVKRCSSDADLANLRDIMASREFQEMIATKPVDKWGSPIRAYEALIDRTGCDIPLDGDIFGMACVGLIAHWRDMGENDIQINKYIDHLNIRKFAGMSKNNVIDTKSNSVLKTSTYGTLEWGDNYYNANGNAGTRSPANPNVMLYSIDEIAGVIPDGWRLPTIDELSGIAPMIGTNIHFDPTGCVDGDGEPANESSACFWRQGSEDFDGVDTPQVAVIHDGEFRPDGVDDPTGYRAALRLVRA